MATQRGVLYVVSEVDRMRRTLELSENVSTLAARYLRSVLESDDVPVDSHDRLASTVFYMSCRTNSPGVVLDDIAEVSRPTITRKEIATKARRIQSALSIDLGLKDKVASTEEFCRELDLTAESVDEILALAKKLREENVLVNKQASTFAGATIYAYAAVEELDLTQREIATATRTTEVTIRNNYPAVLQAMDREIPRSVDNPESVPAGIDRLESESAAQTSRAHDLFETAAYEPSQVASEAAVAGAFFLVAGRRGDGITDLKRIATSVGASEQAIKDHAETIEQELTDD